MGKLKPLRIAIRYLKSLRARPQPKNCIDRPDMLMSACFHFRVNGSEMATARSSRAECSREAAFPPPELRHRRAPATASVRASWRICGKIVQRPQSDLHIVKGKHPLKKRQNGSIYSIPMLNSTVIAPTLRPQT